jgi:hypothetical protein
MSSPDVVITTSPEVRGRLVEALMLDLIGQWAGHELADERLPGYIRPSNWYLASFLIPSATPPEGSSDPDDDEDLDEVPYEVKAQRLEPVGLVYLWPETN